MVDCRGICFHITSNAGVLFPDFWVIEFAFLNAMGVKALHDGLVFSLIEHRHFSATAPTPEPLHNVTYL